MQELRILEHENIRVVTSKQIAEAYEVDAKTITKNFNRNKDKYVEGKHFIALEGKEKIDFINQGQIDSGSKNAKTLYLWTERGALLLAKSLNTDKAWEAYENLVDFYFQKKEEYQQERRIAQDIKSLRPVRDTWYKKNEWKIKIICKEMDWEYKYLYHKILSELNEFYRLEFFENEYLRTYGKIPQYPIDIVEVSPQLERLATAYLDVLYDEIDCNKYI